MPFSWRLEDQDREIFSRELEDFVPPRVFDAHVHLYDKRHFGPERVPAPLQPAPETVDREDFRELIQWIMPGRRVDGLFIPYPSAAVEEEAPVNEFIAREGAGEGCAAEFLVRPEMDPEFVRQEVRRLRVAGLKCYHIFGSSRPTWQAAIPDFLPEAQVAVAHQEKLVITLHIVRSAALADPDNQEVISRYCRRYPDMRLILAHAGRGFNPYHTLRGLAALGDLSNLWYDTSAVTESLALEALLREGGWRRLLWGSDFPISHYRGRCVGVGDDFVWLDEEVVERLGEGRAQIRPTLIGLESLRSLRQAVCNVGLSGAQIEDLFFGNGRRLLGVT